MLIGIINNIALLLALGLLYDTLVLSRTPSGFSWTKVLTGCVIGIMGIAVMLNPWQLAPGIVFDTRSVLLSLSGLYFGLVPTLLAMLMTAVFRVYQGGDGMWMGIAVIVATGTAGILWRHLRKGDLARISMGELYLFGVVVHVIMLVCTVFLPGELVYDIVSIIILPVLLLYPVGTLLLGKLLSGRLILKRANEALRRGDELFHIITGSAVDCIFIMDQHERYTFVNPVMEKLLGIPRAGLLGNTPDVIFTGETLDSFLKFSRSALGGTIVNTVQNATIRGEQKILHSVLVPLYQGQDGGVTGICGIVRDITTEKNREAYMQQQQRLESIGMLAAGVAHEINNPLNIIMNYGELIIHLSDPESRVADYAHNIVDEGDRISHIVRNLLMFSRQDNEPQAVANIGDIIKATLSLTGATMRKDLITVSSRIEDNLPEIACQSQKIMQVLMNLLTNARDALNDGNPEKHGEKRIAVIAGVVDEDGRRWLRITVEDTGTGIPPSLRDKIFDPFFTTKSRDRGTGLGLSISHGIVKEHNGRLRVEDNVPQGTRFHVDLPVDDRT